MKLLHCSITYWQFLPDFCKHQAVVSITVSIHKRLTIKHTWLSSCLSRCDQSIDFSIQRSLYVFVNFVMQEHCTFDSYIWCKVYDSQLLFLVSCELLFLTVTLKTSSFPILALKSLNKIFMWYLGTHQIHAVDCHNSCPLYTSSLILSWTCTSIIILHHWAHSIIYIWWTVAT